MIVWGGIGEGGLSEHWREIQSEHRQLGSDRTTSAPTPRCQHTAVWTGSEMIVWGGADDVGNLDTGGRYNPEYGQLDTDEHN